MESYEIIITPDASADLWELRNYIANVLLVPETVLEYVRSIRKEIATLSEMPGRIKPVDDEPWHSRGLRKIITENFYVYFRIAEEEKRVYNMSTLPLWVTDSFVLIVYIIPSIMCSFTESVIIKCAFS